MWRLRQADEEHVCAPVWKRKSVSSKVPQWKHVSWVRCAVQANGGVGGAAAEVKNHAALLFTWRCKARTPPPPPTHTHRSARRGERSAPSRKCAPLNQILSRPLLISTVLVEIFSARRQAGPHEYSHVVLVVQGVRALFAQLRSVRHPRRKEND
jgi:hypothetical protein